MEGAFAPRDEEGCGVREEGGKGGAHVRAAWKGGGGGDVGWWILVVGHGEERAERGFGGVQGGVGGVLGSNGGVADGYAGCGEDGVGGCGEGGEEEEEMGEVGCFHCFMGFMKRRRVGVCLFNVDDIMFTRRLD